MSIKSNFDLQKYYDNETFDRNEIVKIKKELEEENIPYNYEDIIVSFIYLCKGDIKIAKNTLKGTYLCKKNIPEIFTNRTFEDERVVKQWKTIQIGGAPEFMNGEGPVIFFRFVGAPASEFDFVATVKIFIMTIDSFFYEHLFRGITIFIDLKDMYFSHMFRLNIRLLRKLMKYAQGGLAHLVNKVHFVNGGFLIEKLMKIMKMVSSAEILAKFIFHRNDMDWEEFYRDHISRNFLPSDYGGTLESFELLQQKLWERFVNLNENFKREEILYAT